MKSRLLPLAQKLGIKDVLKKFPYEVSGGQKQGERAAVARALITDPQIILADEPTGALDSRASEGLLKLFQEINEEGQTILMVTHMLPGGEQSANRVLFTEEVGEVYHQIYRGNDKDEKLYQKISDTLTMIATGGERNAWRILQ